MTNRPATSEILAREVCESFCTRVAKVGHQTQVLDAGDRMERDVQLRSAAGRIVVERSSARIGARTAVGDVSIYHRPLR